MHEIFLSHSGKQKGFVRRLYEALQRAGHVPFFDVESLRPGELFPPAIGKALQECHVGVIVLSEDFLTTHWPMKELGLLHSRLHELQEQQQQQPCSSKNACLARQAVALKKPIIYPIFYEVTPDNLKLPENLSRWRLAWKNLEAKHTQLDTSLWEEAVRELPTHSGEVLRRDVSENDFISKIVDKISRMVPIPLLYDETGLSGQDRLKELIVAQFGRAEPLCKSRSLACVIGLYGVAGAGKTTLCHLTSNKFSSYFPGKSICLEFPSNADNSVILDLYKNLLKKCSDASAEHVVDKIISLEQVFPELRRWMPQQDVFLAVDNVWESSAEAARRLLEVGFGRGSKIMVTSRSKVVLENILEGCEHATCIQEVPTLEKAEALSVLERWFRGDLSSLSDNQQLDRLLAKCVFNGAYHPLVLQAQGIRVRRRLNMQLVGEIQSNTVLMEAIDKAVGCDFGPLTEKEIENLLGKNYGEMSPIKKHMFLDVAILFLGWLQTKNHFRWLSLWCSSFEGIKKGLSSLYDRSEDAIQELLHELEADGLLQFQGKKNLWILPLEPWGCVRVEVHDLYAEVARKEAENSGRFLFGDTWNCTNVRQASRAFVSAEHYAHLIRCERDHKLDNLEVLIVAGRFSETIEQLRIDGMEALRMLLVDVLGHCVRLRLCTRKCSGSRLVWLYLSGCSLEGQLRAQFQVLNAKKLQVVVLAGSGSSAERSAWSGVLARLPRSQLVILVVDHVPVEAIDVVEVRLLEVSNCLQLREIRGRGVHHLGVLSVSRCDQLRSVDLEGLSSLQAISLDSCNNLTVLPALNGLSLQKITIRDCNNIAALPLNGLSGLKSICVNNCNGIKALPALDGLTSLQEINILYCNNITVLPALNGLTSLRRINILRCDNMTALLALNGLTSLKSISISRCKHMREPAPLDGLASLETIQIYGCDNITYLPALNGLTSLKSIEIHSCRGMTALPPLDGLTSLQHISIKDCHSIAYLPELNGLTALKSIDFCVCKALRALPPLNGLTNLQSIYIYGCHNVTYVPALNGLTSLKSLEIQCCQGMRALPPLDGLTSLQRISINDCHNIGYLPELNGLTALKSIDVCVCKALRALPPLNGLTNLQSIYMYGCDNIQPPPPNLPVYNSSVYDCMGRSLFAFWDRL